MTLPPITTINLTGDCKLRCPFCYGPPGNSKTIETAAWHAILEFLYQQGVRILIIGGGEPLLYPGLKEVLQFAQNKHFKIILATSCPSVDVVLEIASLIDWFEISLHGSTSEIHATAGGSTRNHSLVLEVLSSLTARSRPKLKINTVVTPMNVTNLPRLATLIARYRVSTWKLFEVRLRGAALNNPANYQYRFTKQNILFLESALEYASKQMPNTRIIISKASSGDNAYLIIYPDGQALIPQGNKYIEIGNLSSINSWSTNKLDAFVRTANEKVETHRVVREFETSFERVL